MDSDKKIRNGFQKALLLEIQSLDSLYGDSDGRESRRPSRRRIDPADDREAFDRDRTPGEEDVDLDIDGQDIDVTAAQAQVVEALYAHVDSIEQMIKELNDPRSENSLNRFLAQIERPDNVGAGLSDKLTRHIVKAATAIATLKVELESVLGREEVLNRKLEGLNAT